MLILEFDALSRFRLTLVEDSGAGDGRRGRRKGTGTGGGDGEGNLRGSR